MFSVETATEDPVAMEFWKNKKEVWANTEKLSTFVGKSTELNASSFLGSIIPRSPVVEPDHS
jgi:hypothetical protein